MQINTKFLDGVRFLLAIWVVIAHVYVAMGAHGFIHIPIMGSVLLKADTAVDCFMLITGFLMTYHYFLREKEEPFSSSRTALNFITRRIFRLYPVYLLAITIAYLSLQSTSLQKIKIIKFFTGSTTKIWGDEVVIQSSSITDLLSHLTFTYGFIPQYVNTIIGPAWSLALEMQFYVVFPLLFLILFARKSNLIMIIFIISSIIAAKLMPHFFGLYGEKGTWAHFGSATLLPYKLPIFLLGMVIAGFVLNKIKLRYMYLSVFLIIPTLNKFTILIISGLILLFFIEKFQPRLNKTMHRTIAIILSILSCKQSKVGADISYSLYITHWFIMPHVIGLTITLLHYQNKYLVAIVALLNVLIINFVISFMLYRLIEKPFIKLGKQFTKSTSSIKPSTQPCNLR